MEGYSKNKPNGGSRLLRVTFAVFMLLAILALLDKIFHLGVFDIVN